MTILKRVLYTSLALSSFVFISTDVFATSAPAAMVSVGEVNIEGAKINDQVGNVVSASFTISNGKGIQSDVRYGIRLVSSTNKQVIVDEKVYEEALSLSENTKISKTVVYKAPETLSGTYIVYIRSSNTSGFPFGTSYAGTIKLEASKKWITIDPESCATSIVGATDKKTYKLYETPVLHDGQSLKLSCTATNMLGGLLAVTPTFNIFEQTIFGKPTEQSRTLAEQTVFKMNEKKTITTILPKGPKPQLYVTKVSFGTEQQQSNPIFVQYRIDGPVATIINTSADKDYYTAGDSAKILLLWQSNSPVSAQTTVTTSRGSLCGKLTTEDLSKGVQTLDVPIKRPCVDPRITVKLKDTTGSVLAERVLEIKTVSVNTTASIFSGKKGALLIFLIIAVIILIGIFLKKRGFYSKVPTTPLVIIVVLLSLGVFSKVDASQYLVGPSSDIIVDVNIGSTTFKPGDTITVQGTVTSNSPIDNTVTFSAVTVGNSSVNLFPGPRTLPANGSLVGDQQALTAPATEGSYTVDFTVGVEDPTACPGYLTWDSSMNRCDNRVSAWNNTTTRGDDPIYINNIFINNAKYELTPPDYVIVPNTAAYPVDGFAGVPPATTTVQVDWHRETAGSYENSGIFIEDTNGVAQCARAYSSPSLDETYTFTVSMDGPAILRIYADGTKCY